MYLVVGTEEPFKKAGNPKDAKRSDKRSVAIKAYGSDSTVLEYW